LDFATQVEAYDFRRPQPPSFARFFSFGVEEDVARCDSWLARQRSALFFGPSCGLIFFPLPEGLAALRFLLPESFSPAPFERRPAAVFLFRLAVPFLLEWMVPPFSPDIYLFSSSFCVAAVA